MMGPALKKKITLITVIFLIGSGVMYFLIYEDVGFSHGRDIRMSTCNSNKWNNINSLESFFKTIYSVSANVDDTNNDKKHIKAKSKSIESVSQKKTQGSTCKPVEHYVFVKTAKTGGSTVAGILRRYGMTHGLVAALPVNHSSHINIIKGNAEIIRYPCADNFPGYNYLASHIGYYNYTVLRHLIPKAKFISILRAPHTQLESAFYYLQVDKKMNLGNSSNPFAEFLRNVSYNYMRILGQGKNGQLQKLGYRWQDHNDPLDVGKKIEDLSKEIDLVMITEYMDESLVLLKKLLCWSFDDMVYISCRVRSKTSRPPFTEKMKAIASAWNADDLRLYRHFNETFWQKIKDYDGNFQEDLRLFQELKNKTLMECAGPPNKCPDLRVSCNTTPTLISAKQYARFCAP